MYNQTNNWKVKDQRWSIITKIVLGTYDFDNKPTQFT